MVSVLLMVFDPEMNDQFKKRTNSREVRDFEQERKTVLLRRLAANSWHDVSDTESNIRAPNALPDSIADETTKLFVDVCISSALARLQSSKPPQHVALCICMRSSKRSIAQRGRARNELGCVQRAPYLPFDVVSMVARRLSCGPMCVAGAVFRFPIRECRVPSACRYTACRERNQCHGTTPYGMCVCVCVRAR